MSKYIFDPPYNHWYGVKHLPNNRYKMHFCGFVSSTDNLPTENAATGDVYIVTEDEVTVVFVGGSWIPLTNLQTENNTNTAISSQLEDYQEIMGKDNGTNDYILTFDLGTYDPTIAGFKDVIIVNSYLDAFTAIASVSDLDPNPIGCPVTPTDSSESLFQSYVRFWNDGGMIRVVNGTGYNYNKSVFPTKQDYYCFNANAQLVSEYPCFRFIAITRNRTTQPTLSDVTNVKVYARYPVLISELEAN